MGSENARRFEARMRRVGAIAGATGFLVFILSVVFPNTTSGRMILVPSDFPTIQAALDTATNGDEIVVAPGMYREFVHFAGRDVVLRSTDPTSPSIVTATILNPAQSGTVVTFSGDETSTCVLAGFTITNTERTGNPRIQGNGAQATIRYCVVTNDSTEDAGRGIVGIHGLVENCFIQGNAGGLADCLDADIHKNVISDNVLDPPGNGAGLLNCYGKIRNNLIARNFAGIVPGSGGGLHSCKGSIKNNVILANVADAGGGMAYCRGEFVGNYFIDNYGRLGGAGYGCSGPYINDTFYHNTYTDFRYFGSTGRGPYINCIFKANDLPVVEDLRIAFNCCVENLDEEGNGNFAADPRFVDEAKGDVRLSSTSPCIDAGQPVDGPDFDIEGNPRGLDVFPNNLSGSDIDIGADEYSGPGSLFSAPDRPVNIYPPDGRDDVPSFPVLQVGNFHDLQPGVGFLASEWQMGSTGGFHFPLHDIVLYGKEKTRLPLTKDYFSLLKVLVWRVRFQNSLHVWSEWSRPTIFTLRPEGVIRVPQDYASIQSAIDVVGAGGEIVVDPGRYAENLKIPEKSFTLRSTDPTNPSIVNRTILDGADRGSVIQFLSPYAAVRIAGFTITNGSGNFYFVASFGGGILGGGSGVIIENNRIVKNHIESLTPYEASGSAIEGCAGVIRNNIIAYNSGEICHSAVYGCNGALVNNVFYRNSGKFNYITLGDCRGTIRNNVLWVNLPIYNCAAPSYCVVIPPVDTGTGNLSADPRFVDPDHGDFRLLPDSPCIDAGGATDSAPTDSFGQSRPYVALPGSGRGDGSGFDIGVFEYRPYSPEELFRFSFLRRIYAGTEEDANGDGFLDVADLIYTRAHKL